MTYIHRRLWAAVVRLAPVIGPERLAMIHETHTPAGAHKTTAVPFPDWLPDDLQAAARRLSEDEAWAHLEGLADVLRPTTRGDSSRRAGRRSG